MKVRLTEQYDVALGKREMDELMLVMRVYAREFAASELCQKMLAELEEVYQGGGAGLGIEPPETPDEGEEGLVG